MKKNNHIVENAKAIVQNRQEPERLHVLARSYWRLMILIVSMFLIGAVVYGAVVFAGVISDLGDRGANDVNASAPTLTRKQLVQVVVGLSARQSRFDELKSNAPIIVDPSK